MEDVLLRLAGLAFAAIAARQTATPIRIGPQAGALIETCIASGTAQIAPAAVNTVRRYWLQLRALERDDRELGQALRALLDRMTRDGSLLHPADDDIDGLGAESLAGVLLPGADEADDARHLLVLLLDAALDEAPRILPIAAAIVAALPQLEATSVARTTLHAVAADIATATGMSDDLVALLVERIRATRACEHDITDELPEAVAEALETIGAIEAMRDLVGDEDTLDVRLGEIAEHLRRGDFAAARAMLAIVAGGVERSTIPQRQRLIRELKAAMAAVEALVGNWREASRRYAEAAEAWPREDRLTRWRLKRAEGSALAAGARTDPQAPRVAGLCRAAQVLAAAGGLVSEQDCPGEWAEANLHLGRLLLELADLECRPERYLAAALHFKPAIEVFAREGTSEPWARAQLALGHALRGQASFQRDIVTLKDAAFAYRATLGVVTRATDSRRWLEARAALAEVLSQIGAESGDVGAIHEATEIVLPLVDGAIDRASRGGALAHIAYARTMRTLVELGGEDAAAAALLRDAQRALLTALAAPDGHLTRLERAHAEWSLGLAGLLLLHSGVGDDPRRSTVEPLLRAHALMSALEDEVSTYAIECDIAEAEAVVAPPCERQHETAA